MKKFLIISAIFVTFLVAIIIGLTFYVNSNHAGGVLASMLTESLGNRCKFSKHSISSSGKIDLKDFELFSATDKKVVSFDSIEVNLSWSEILLGKIAPTQLKIKNIAVDLEVKNGLWDLAILNDRKPLPPETNLFVQLQDGDVLLKRIQGLPDIKYSFEVVSSQILNSLTDPVTNISLYGNVGLERLDVDQFKTYAFGGDIMVTAGASYDLNNKEVPIKDFSCRAVINDLNIKSLTTLAGKHDAELDGSLSGDVTLSVNSDMSPVMQSSFTFDHLTFFHPDLGPILRQLKYPENVLVFDRGDAELSFVGNRLTVKRAGFYNEKMLTVTTENTILDTIDFKPDQIILPLKLSAPYRIVRVKELRNPNDPTQVEVELKIKGHVSEIPALIQDALMEKAANLLLEKGDRELERLNKKLNIKIGGKKLDVNSIIDIFRKK